MLFSSDKIETITRKVDSNLYQKTNPRLHPVLRQIYASRGLIGQQMNHSLKYLKEPKLITGIEKSAEILKSCIVNRQQICIVGDYDVDGATSSALLTSALLKLDARVNYLIPNRMIDGYGLSKKVVNKVIENYPECRLIITVDNGISSVEGVLFAKKNGIKVIITDHHLPGNELPDADGIVNPNLTNNHPLKNLSGVGVSFYFLCVLIEIFKKNNLDCSLVNLKEYLDYVALGTVADCVLLDYNNRILVLNGIELLRHTPRMGIKKLIQLLKNINQKELTSTDISFYLAPTLNAAGRIKNMSIGVECLLAEDPKQAENLANQLIDLNTKRKAIQSSMKKSADELIEKIDLTENYHSFCFYNHLWHEGISGILASKLKEQLLRPVIVFAQSDNQEILKGSARSIEFLNIKDVLEKIAEKNPNLMIGFGGHAMAAGLQIQKENLARFSETFAETIKSFTKSPIIKKTVVYSDGELETQQINSELALLLKKVACWGSGLESPLFHGNFYITYKSIFAQSHIKLGVCLDRKSRISFPAICFFQADKFDLIGEVGEKIILCYQLDINKYNDSLQLIIRYLIKDE